MINLSAASLLLAVPPAIARWTPRSANTTSPPFRLADRDVGTACTIEQNADGSIPLFEYEISYLNEGSLKDTLSRLSNTDQDLSVFDFASINVATDTCHEDLDNLPGPDNCKAFPGDDAWPSIVTWAALSNATNGALLKPAPQAHICYNDTVDEGACQSMGESWTDPFFHLEDPLEMLSAIYEGMTCQPPSVFDSGNCRQGGYPVYVVNASSVADIQLAVNFARNTGVRFVVKNTGHDFAGKSGGAGALSVWTHNLKDISFIPSYSSSHYTGPAVKAAAGVQGFELYAAARDYGVAVLSGECPTVGMVGGWVQGGGHSPLSGVLGMGADQVLGFEVVLADGRFVTANAEENSELFWSLRGGGGLTYGVVTSAIVKAHPDMPITSASFSFSTNANVTRDMFSAGLKAFYSYFPENADRGIYSYFSMFNIDGAYSFSMAPFFVVNQTAEEAKGILQPWLNDMDHIGIPITPDWQSFDGFYEAYNASFPVEGVNNKGVVTGSRLFPRKNWANETIFNTTYDAIWSNLEDGMALISYNMAPTWEKGGREDTAVNPAWRETIGFVITGIVQDLTEPANKTMAERRNFTNGPMQHWRDISPGAGSYLAEGDRLEPNWQWSFYGSYYPRLLEAKKRLDPFNVFWAHTAVGSEFFELRSFNGLADENGRLCRNEMPTLYVAEGPDWVPGQ